MEHFYIIANPKRDQELRLTKELCQFILKHGKSCGYQANQEPEGISFDRRRWHFAAGGKEHGGSEYSIDWYQYRTCRLSL